MESFRKRMNRKTEREDTAGRLMREKGKDMNRAEKAFVGNFAKDECEFEKKPEK